MLARQPSEIRTFLLRTSVLRRLSGPLCDAVLEVEGSSGRLEELERSNLFLVSLDDRREWYRYHHLFGELLHLELASREPGLALELHRRAAAWHRATGDVDESYLHAIAAGELSQAGELIASHWLVAVIGLRQEAKAEESVKALAQMMKTVARVGRGGQALDIDAEELVPGDVVLMEAGNRVPADGRICVAATFEIEEAALTGESLPVAKGIEPVPGDEVALGDRTCMAYMNTSATTETDKTPLQKQLDGLSKIIAAIAGVALLLVIALGLIP